MQLEFIKTWWTMNPLGTNALFSKFRRKHEEVKWQVGARSRGVQKWLIEKSVSESSEL